MEKIEEARVARHRLRWQQDAELDSFLFERRLQQAKWYWANIVFEFLFLSGLVWFAGWPAVQHKRPWSWALHLGLTPIFFMLPVYLGYATFTFTSRGPSGGVLYPWLIQFFPRASLTQADRIILERLPQILEPLSQGIGIPIALTGLGFPSPTVVVKFSIIVAVVAFFIAWWFKRVSKASE